MSLLHGFIPSTQKKHKLKNINEKSIPKLLNEIISRIRNVQDAVVTHLKLPLNRWDLNLFISYLMSQNCHSGDNFLRLYFGNIFPLESDEAAKVIEAGTPKTVSGNRHDKTFLLDSPPTTKGETQHIQR